MTMRTVGVGKCVELGGTTLLQLEAELKRIREQHVAPDEARIARVGVGSSYLLEVIWIEESDGC